MKKRAEAQDETRTRIVEAIVKLHETVGPKATTVSAIAEEAGVQRLTVYRHFPDETALFEACTSHWAGQNPAPDPAIWDVKQDPAARARTAIAAFYDWYEDKQAMLSAAWRDVELVPALQPMMQEQDMAMAGLSSDLASQFGTQPPDLGQTLRHVLAFTTWQALDRQGIENAAKVDLAMRWIDGVLAGAA